MFGGFNDFQGSTNQEKTEYYDVSVNISASIEATSEAEAERKLKNRLQQYIQSDPGFNVSGNVNTHY